jgi:hypothetical protein
MLDLLAEAHQLSPDRIPEETDRLEKLHSQGDDGNLLLI